MMNTSISEKERLQSLESVRVYTLAEVAPTLGVTRRTLLTYIKSKRLNAVKVGGQWKISLASLKKFVEGA